MVQVLTATHSPAAFRRAPDSQATPTLAEAARAYRSAHAGLAVLRSMSTIAIVLMAMSLLALVSLLVAALSVVAVSAGGAIVLHVAMTVVGAAAGDEARAIGGNDRYGKLRRSAAILAARAFVVRQERCGKAE